MRGRSSRINQLRLTIICGINIDDPAASERDHREAVPDRLTAGGVCAPHSLTTDVLRGEKAIDRVRAVNSDSLIMKQIETCTGDFVKTKLCSIGKILKTVRPLINPSERSKSSKSSKLRDVRDS